MSSSFFSPLAVPFPQHHFPKIAFLPSTALCALWPEITRARIRVNLLLGDLSFPAVLCVCVCVRTNPLWPPPCAFGIMFGGTGYPTSLSKSIRSCVFLTLRISACILGSICQVAQKSCCDFDGIYI